ncbi:MAG: (2Fe-2S)-binding protein [Beijerinckiaceae bacterium]
MFRKLNDAEASDVTVFLEGVALKAESGESLAAVILRAPEPWTRTTPVSESPRAPYCMMGVCFECLVEVDGRASVQSCLTPVRDGMQVKRQRGRRVLSS